MKPTKITVRQLRKVLKSYPDEAIVVGKWDGKFVKFDANDVYLLKNDDDTTRDQPVLILDVSDYP